MCATQPTARRRHCPSSLAVDFACRHPQPTRQTQEEHKSKAQDDLDILLCPPPRTRHLDRGPRASDAVLGIQGGNRLSPPVVVENDVDVDVVAASFIGGGRKVLLLVVVVVVVVAIGRRKDGWGEGEKEEERDGIRGRSSTGRTTSILRTRRHRADLAAVAVAVVVRSNFL